MNKIIFNSQDSYYSSTAATCFDENNNVLISHECNKNNPIGYPDNLLFSKKFSPLFNYISFDSSVSFLQKQDSGIIPPGLLFVDKNILVYEKPPTYQNVFVIEKLVNDIDYESDKPKLFRLPIPWQLYIVHFSDFTTTNVRMHFMDGPLSSIDQQMYLAPLTNFYSSGDLCRPFFSDMDDIERYSKDLSGVMASSYDWVWNSGTNLDLTQAIVAMYYQASVFGSQFHKNSLLQNSSHSSFSYEQYYCSPNYVTNLYRLWERFEVHEVSSLSWPKNSLATSFNEDFMQARVSRMSDYLSEHSNLREYVTSECCENCCYTNEDGDMFDNDDCECECHYSESAHIDYNHFYQWAGLIPPVGVNFINSYKTFRHLHNLPQETLMQNIKINRFAFDKIYSEILHSSE